MPSITDWLLGMTANWSVVKAPSWVALKDCNTVVVKYPTVVSGMAAMAVVVIWLS